MVVQREELAAGEVVKSPLLGMLGEMEYSSAISLSTLFHWSET